MSQKPASPTPAPAPAPIDPANLTPEQLAEFHKRAIATLWTRGHLRVKLDETQLKIYDALKIALESGASSYYLLCSRRLGKTYMLLVMALMQCLQKANSRVLFLAPWSRNAEEIVTDILPMILDDCPQNLLPEFKAQSREYKFKNGSILRLKGTNGEHAQFLRGGAADLIILDECGIMDRLKHVIDDVAMPMTLTCNGKILLATTPPITPSHESATIYEEHSAQNLSALYTIRDATNLTYESKRRALSQAGEDPDRIDGILDGTLAPETTTARREYFCEFCTDASLAVIPEYTGQRRLEILRTWDRPVHYDAITGIDPGQKDRTGLLFCYTDFLNGKLIVEDEALLRGPNTTKIAETIKEKEAALWGEKIPYQRVTDVDLRLVADLYSLHGILAHPVKNKQALGDINLLRTMIQNNQIIINPRCINLDRQLKNAIWNTRGTDFARPEDSNTIDGHFDLVACLKYITRSVDLRHNPYPDNWWMPGGKGGTPPNTWISPKNKDPRFRRRSQNAGLRDNTPVARRFRDKKTK